MLKRYRWAALGVAAFCALSATVYAVAQNKADATLDRVKANVQKSLGADALVKSAARTPLLGVYEVLVGSEVMYADEKGAYLIVGGNLFDTKARKNLTEARQSEINKIDFAKLPFEHAIKYVKGNGSRKIAVFADPNCGYCKRFEASLKSKAINNITVYTFLYPVLGADSTAKSKAIWCSPDRLAAWQDWMINHKAPTAAGECATPLDQVTAFGREHNVTGTPMIVLSDGRRLPGAVPIAELEKALASVK